MKKFTKVLSIIMAFAMLAALATACGTEEAPVADNAAQDDVVVVDYSKSVENANIVAEAGSAGEELANGNEFFANAKFTPVDSMSKALMDVSSGVSDIAIVDYVTAIGSIGEGTDLAGLSIVEGKDFSPEQYGIAFRKGSDAVVEVNKIIADLMADGTMDKIADKYKLGELLIKDGAAQEDSISEGDLAYIKDKGELIIGITLFAPMNFEDDNKELTGFETEFAKAVCEKLGVTPKFEVINWNAKEVELNAKNIDCIWNGMTITDERLETMSISAPYMENKQVMVSKTK